MCYFHSTTPHPEKVHGLYLRGFCLFIQSIKEEDRIWPRFTFEKYKPKSVIFQRARQWWYDPAVKHVEHRWNKIPSTLLKLFFWKKNTALAACFLKSWIFHLWKEKCEFSSSLTGNLVRDWDWNEYQGSSPFSRPSRCPRSRKRSHNLLNTFLSHASI